MQVVYCKICKERISQKDLDKNQAISVKGEYYCSKCKAHAPEEAPPQIRKPPTTKLRFSTPTKRIVTTKIVKQPIRKAKTKTGIIIGVIAGVALVVIALIILTSPSGQDKRETSQAPAPTTYSPTTQETKPSKLPREDTTPQHVIEKQPQKSEEKRLEEVFNNVVKQIEEVYKSQKPFEAYERIEEICKEMQWHPDIHNTPWEEKLIQLKLEYARKIINALVKDIQKLLEVEPENLSEQIINQFDETFNRTMELSTKTGFSSDELQKLEQILDEKLQKAVSKWISKIQKKFEEKKYKEVLEIAKEVPEYLHRASNYKEIGKLKTDAIDAIRDEERKRKEEEQRKKEEEERKKRQVEFANIKWEISRDSKPEAFKVEKDTLVCKGLKQATHPQGDNIYLPDCDIIFTQNTYKNYKLEFHVIMIEGSTLSISTRVKDNNFSGTLNLGHQTTQEATWILTVKGDTIDIEAKTEKESKKFDPIKIKDAPSEGRIAFIIYPNYQAKIKNLKITKLKD